MIISDESNKSNHNPSWVNIPDHLYRFITVRGSGSGKTNSLLNLISPHRDTEESIYTSKIQMDQSINYYRAWKIKTCVHAFSCT